MKRSICILMLIALLFSVGAEASLLKSYNIAPGQTVGLDSAYTYAVPEQDGVHIALDETGTKLTGLSNGSSVMTAENAEGTITTVPVKVAAKKYIVTSLSLSKSSVSLVKGKKTTIRATVKPSTAKVKTVVWATSDPSVASVTQKGVITARSVGTAVITATASSGITKRVTVKVTPIMPSRVRLNRTGLSIVYGKSSKLTATVYPANAQNRTVVWKSSKPNIVSVDENGLVTAKGSGSAVITAYSCNKKKATCRVNVKYYKLKKVALNTDVLYATTGSEPYRFKVKYQPSNASRPQFTWTSSNENVAVVDETGLVTFTGVGVTKVTAVSVENKKLKSTCTIHVREPGQEGLPLSGLTIGLNPGHQAKANLGKAPIAPGSKTKGYLNKAGATGVKTRIPEYKAVLNVSLYLRDILVEAGANVVMTRTENNVNISNIERAYMLNRAGCDVALQIHMDSMSNRSLNGISLYTRKSGAYTAESAAMAKSILKGMIASTGAKSRGTLKSSGYMSLNYSTVPSILIECGFLSNVKEDALLNNPAYQQKLAQGITNGLISFFSN